ncbi:MAG: diguanylate cyclase [Fimbriimonadaceae bacterium]|nr:diguanylate cyclase [Fimbriimonadaceae bacterium]
MRILVAEDDGISRTLLVRSLEKLGHTVTAAEDGEVAWQRFGEGDFEAIVSDWMMPGTDGLELCRRVRAATDRPYTYFMLLTALDATSHLVSGMEAGADDYLTKPLNRDALSARLIAAERIIGLHRQLTEQNIALAALNSELYNEGRMDALTRVGNRLRMNEDLAAVHDRVNRYGHRYCVALCDIDYFKRYNDSCGHQAGDEALRAVATSLAQQSRVSDAVYRYGGEEFLVVLPEQTVETAEIAMERMRHAIEALQIAHPGREPAGVVTISCGLAEHSQGLAQTYEELLRRADVALYEAKQGGRNQVVVAGATVP